ncbi:MAG TPA: hypothetical protein QGI71_01405 [Dehalococcoidia bacterium]|jgi:hypothetical protein|nr:hypothetical protein [Dehalococcoidia bacterium]
MSTSQGDSSELPSIRIRAINSASESRGSIHDDEKAREMGYRGGLVPGVTVLGYMSRMMREHFGDAWTADGSFSALIRRPVYEGDEISVEGRASTPGSGDRVSVSLRVLDSEGSVCATAEASCRTHDQLSAG